LEEAMSAVEEQGPWMWEVHYGKDLWYECQETSDNDAKNPNHWEQLEENNEETND